MALSQRVKGARLEIICDVHVIEVLVWQGWSGCSCRGTCLNEKTASLLYLYGVGVAHQVSSPCPSRFSIYMMSLNFWDLGYTRIVPEMTQTYMSKYIRVALELGDTSLLLVEKSSQPRSPQKALLLKTKDDVMKEVMKALTGRSVHCAKVISTLMFVMIPIAVRCPNNTSDSMVEKINAVFQRRDPSFGIFEKVSLTEFGRFCRSRMSGEELRCCLDWGWERALDLVPLLASMKSLNVGASQILEDLREGPGDGVMRRRSRTTRGSEASVPTDDKYLTARMHPS